MFPSKISKTLLLGLTFCETNLFLLAFWCSFFKSKAEAQQAENERENSSKMGVNWELSKRLSLVTKWAELGSHRTLS